MSAMRGILPCEGNGLSAAAPPPLRKRPARVQIHHPGTLRLPMDQPESPRRFFLPDLVTGGGIPIPVTQDNEVRYLVDAPAYFGDLATEISAAGDPATKGTFASDFIYIIGWYVGMDFPLVPEIRPPASSHGSMTSVATEQATQDRVMESTLRRLLHGAARRGAEIRLLMFANPTSTINNTAAEVVNNMKDESGADLNTFAILDGRLLQAGAHHQKLIVIRRNLEITGYCGGIDLNPDRLFPMHIAGVRSTLNPSADIGDPYHDVQCRIRGPATGWLLRTFTERWEDHRTHGLPFDVSSVRNLAQAEERYQNVRQFYEQHLHNTTEREAALQKLEQARAEAQAALDSVVQGVSIPRLCVDSQSPLPAANPPGKSAFANRQIVQIGRTYGDPLHHSFWSPFKNERGMDPLAPPAISDVTGGPVDRFDTYDFAPHGEQNIKRLLLRAISRAQKFIYVEDQYLMDVEIAQAIAAVLPRLAHFTAMVPTDNDLETSYRPDVAAGKELPWIDLPFKFWKNHAIDLRKKFIGIVTAAGGDRARIFTHREAGGEHTYVHSKMWIVDDEFVLIGSANCCQRSMTHDGEICAAIADQPRPDPCGFSLARRLRMALWAEHLGLDTLEGHAELVDGVASGELWLPDKRPPGHRVMNHEPGNDDGLVILDALGTLARFIPGYVSGAVKLVLGVKKYVLEPAMVPLGFDPYGACPHRNIQQDGTVTFSGP